MSVARRAGAASITALCALSLGLGGLNLFAPQWFQSAGLNLLELHDRLESSETKDQLVSTGIAGSNQRLAFKESLVRKLNLGQSSLSEVCEIFWELNESQPGAMVAIRKTYGAATDQENVVRNVLEFAINRLPQGLTTKMAILGRILNEYRLLVGHDFQ